MRILTIVAALGLIAVQPVAAQPAPGGTTASPGRSTGLAARQPRARIVNSPSGGSPGYQRNTYVRLPSPRTPTDVGNMAFPDPSETPAGDLVTVPARR